LENRTLFTQRFLKIDFVLYFVSVCCITAKENVLCIGEFSVTMKPLNLRPHVTSVTKACGIEVNH